MYVKRNVLKNYYKISLYTESSGINLSNIITTKKKDCKQLHINYNF